MEQKLAAFRARRARTRQGTEEHSEPEGPGELTEPAGLPDTAAPPAEPQNRHTGEELSYREGCDWLLDSALGRWLGIQRLAFTNLTLLKVLLWLVLLGLFSELEFGLPFFLLSLFYWLYEGLRSPTAKKPGELSAYSVFNPDCQPILGTLTAEQLEGEMGYRPMARVRS